MLNGMVSSVSGKVITSGDNLTVDSDAIFQDSSTNNIAIGRDSLDSTSTNSDDNIAIGVNAMTTCVGGDDNVAIGSEAMNNLTNGSQNVSIGYTAGRGLAGGEDNVCIGRQAGYSLLDAGRTVLIGTNAGDSINNNTAIGTIAIGYDAGTALTSGAGNLAIGYNALIGHTTGDKNIAIGSGAMDGTGGATVLGSTENVFIGYDAGGGTWTTAVSNYNVGVGNNVMDGALNGALNNTAMGHDALTTLTSGDNNTAIGYGAGDGITTADYNTAIGRSALSGAASTGNTSVGYASLLGNTGTYNVAMGFQSMYTAVAVDKCVAIGATALYTANTDDADGTVAIGYQAGYNYVPANVGDPATAGTTLIGYHAGYDDADDDFGLTTGIRNTAVGHETLGANAGEALTGTDNAVVGYRAGYGMNGGSNYNTLIGSSCGLALTNGDLNTSLGYSAGDSVTTGSYNTSIGAYSDNVATLDYQTAFGYTAVTQNAYETRIGFSGGIQFYSGQFQATVTDATEFNVADTAYMFKIPAFAFIKSISATCLTLHGDGTADFMIVRSVDSAGADGELLSDNGAFLELLGAGADGTVNTGNLNSGGAYDLQAGSGTSNLKQVWYNEKVANLNTANHATETGVSYIWLLNAGSSNEDANHSTKAKWRVCVEFIGQG